jgi:hypothetical protein
MAKRPSLAASMRAVAKHEAPAAPVIASEEPAPPNKRYFAATREGMKRMTVVVEPDQHKRMKQLALNLDRTVEDLMREAIADLLAKHKG